MALNVLIYLLPIAGIPYLTMADEEKLRIDMEERLKMVNVDDPTATPNNQQSNPEIPDNLKQYMEDTMLA